MTIVGASQNLVLRTPLETWTCQSSPRYVLCESPTCSIADDPSQTTSVMLHVPTLSNVLASCMNDGMHNML